MWSSLKVCVKVKIVLRNTRCISIHNLLSFILYLPCVKDDLGNYLIEKLKDSVALQMAIQSIMGVYDRHNALFEGLSSLPRSTGHSGGTFDKTVNKNTYLVDNANSSTEKMGFHGCPQVLVGALYPSRGEISADT